MFNIFRFKHEDEPPQNLMNKNQELSKAAAKNRRKREAKMRSKQEQSEVGQSTGNPSSYCEYDEYVM